MRRIKEGKNSKGEEQKNMLKKLSKEELRKNKRSNINSISSNNSSIVSISSNISKVNI